MQAEKNEEETAPVEVEALAGNGDVEEPVSDSQHDDDDADPQPPQRCESCSARCKRCTVQARAGMRSCTPAADRLRCCPRAAARTRQACRTHRSTVLATGLLVAGALALLALLSQNPAEPVSAAAVAVLSVAGLALAMCGFLVKACSETERDWEPVSGVETLDRETAQRELKEAGRGAKGMTDEEAAEVRRACCAGIKVACWACED